MGLLRGRQIKSAPQVNEDTSHVLAFLLQKHHLLLEHLGEELGRGLRLWKTDASDQFLQQGQILLLGALAREGLVEESEPEVDQAGHLHLASLKYAV